MVRYPENEFTRAIEDTASANRRGGVASASPAPTARSADLGTFTELPPLTEDERAELDQKMAVLTGEDVTQEIPTEHGLRAQEIPTARMTAREFLRHVPAGGQIAFPTRLPNFVAVEGIDLVRNTVTIDGMKFDITEEEAAEFKQFAVNRARAVIMQNLDQAANLFATPGVTDEGQAPEVQREPEGGSPEPPV